MSEQRLFEEGCGNAQIFSRYPARWTFLTSPVSGWIVSLAEAGAIEVWSHGSSGVLQTTHLWLVEHLGHYLRAKSIGEAEAWVHFSPTTVIVPQTRLTMVMIEARTFGRASIGSVHAWDGARQVLQRDNLGFQSVEGEARLAGQPGIEFRQLELAFDNGPIIKRSIGVSILMTASVPLDAIAIASVGIRLESDRGSANLFASHPGSHPQ